MRAMRLRRLRLHYWLRRLRLAWFLPRSCGCYLAKNVRPFDAKAGAPGIEAHDDVVDTKGLGVRLGLGGEWPVRDKECEVGARQRFSRKRLVDCVLSCGFLLKFALGNEHGMVKINLRITDQDIAAAVAGGLRQFGRPAIQAEKRRDVSLKEEAGAARYLTLI